MSKLFSSLFSVYLMDQYGSLSGGGDTEDIVTLDYYDNRRDRYNYDLMAQKQGYYASWGDDFRSYYDYLNDDKDNR